MYSSSLFLKLLRYFKRAGNGLRKVVLKVVVKFYVKCIKIIFNIQNVKIWIPGSNFILCRGSTEQLIKWYNRRDFCYRIKCVGIMNSFN